MDITTMVIAQVQVRDANATGLCHRSWRIVAMFNSHIEPGQLVVHPQQRDWGVGQVQSAIDDRITVNFPHAGKVLINARIVSLEIVQSAPRD
jgi:hypothetical protein